jgi:hypothetical protein
MKTNLTKRLLLPVLVVALVVAVGSCSKEDLRDSNSHMSERSDLEGTYLDDVAALNNAGGKGAGNAAQNKLLAQIRRATAKYHDFAVAEADGYELDPHCVAVPGVGGMGFHAVKYPLIANIEVDPLQPEVLVYEPTEDGLKLVAVEYIVPAFQQYDQQDDPIWPFPFYWDDHNDDPPMIGDKEFDDHRFGGGGPPFPHYQLHIWLWKGNPSGIYFPLNPNVSCEFSYLFVD